MPGRKGSSEWEKPQKSVTVGRPGDSYWKRSITELTSNYRIVRERAEIATVGQSSPLGPVSASISHCCISSPTCHIRDWCSVAADSEACRSS